MLENRPSELETSLFSLREDGNDDETIHPNILDSVVVDPTIFEGFLDFELDLSCLSAPSSPVASTSSLPAEEPSFRPASPSPPPSPLLSRSMSFSSQLPSLTTKKSTKKASSPQLSSSMGNSRGSWPLIKYAGRGTPIDRNRRLEWGGFAGEDIAEDGVLYTTVRSTSLDGPSQRSVSPDWHNLSPLSSTRSNVTASATESISRLTTESPEPPPELAPIQIDGYKSDEWDTIMQTVLGPATAGPSAPETHFEDEPEPSSAVDEHNPYQKSIPQAEISLMSPEQMQEHQRNTGLQIDLGLNAALDLGLGQRGGMNWFDLGLLPSSASGRESPSLYSQAPTPKATPPPSVHDEPSEQVSPTTTGAEVNESIHNQLLKSLPTPWWKKILHRLRRVQTLITIHKEPF